MINYIERKKVTVVDSIMGSGKTSWAIQFINNAPKHYKFMVVTPYLMEVERIKNATSHKKNFIEPTQDNKKGTKFFSLKKLLEDGTDIVTTHELFQKIDQDILDLLTLHHYILIMDEVADVVDRIDIKQSDIEILLNSNEIKVDETSSQVKWMNDGYDGKFNKLKSTVKSGKVFLQDKTALIWIFPCEVFHKFRQVYILTYMFDAQIQKYYFELNGVEYCKKSVAIDETQAGELKTTLKDGILTHRIEPVYKLIDYRKPYISRFKQRINICQDTKLNDVGNSKLKQGYDDLTYTKLIALNRSNPLAKRLRDNMKNFFINKCKAKSNEIMWTCPKDSIKLLKGKGYTNAHVSSNMRASNDYKDRTVVAYILNKYLHPSITNFFSSKGIVIDQDAYALSELLQWLFRSAIRDDKEIQLYIPSYRMRKLLEMWLNGEI